MEEVILKINTDWWIVSATLTAGVITAIATLSAVVYTNKKTREQLTEQKIAFENEQVEKYKQDCMVVLQSSQKLLAFINVLTIYLLQNNSSRILLFSGNDGFEFFDNQDKCADQKTRILFLENQSEKTIKSIKLTTNSILVNTDTDEKIEDRTENAISFLRPKESIVIRMFNQLQFEKICEINKNKKNCEVSYTCKVEYYTLAKQYIVYLYEIIIKNDRKIEVIKDEIESITDVLDVPSVKPTPFRNLQDNISLIDREDYYWRKVGAAQAEGMLSKIQNNFQQNTTSVSNEHAQEVQ